jgi:hypothetical protein
MIAATGQPDQQGIPDGADQPASAQAGRAAKKRILGLPLPTVKLPKIKRPHFGLRGFAKRKFNEQLKGDKPTPGRVTEEILRLVGFESVVDAWKHPTHRTTKVLVSIANKAADMMAGRIVNMSIRLIAITMLTGFLGGSVLMTMGLTALATGVGSALYTYNRNYLHDRLRGPKEERKNVRYFTRDRLRQAALVFISSAASGAFGAWLGKTDFMQSIVKSVKGFVHHVVETMQSGVHSGANAVESVILPSAPSAAAPPLPPSGTLQKAFAPVAGSVPAVSPDISAPKPVPVPAAPRR